MDSTETNDAFGPPGVFLRMIISSNDRDDEPDRQDVDDLWINIGGEAEPREDQYSSEFWDGFIEGALDDPDKAEFIERLGFQAEWRREKAEEYPRR